MTRYCISAAKPKGATNHLNSLFRLYKKEEDGWSHEGWKSVHQISQLIAGGHVVLTAQINDNKISLGAPVELELRISKNEVKYPISGMPDK